MNLLLPLKKFTNIFNIDLVLQNIKINLENTSHNYVVLASCYLYDMIRQSSTDKLDGLSVKKFKIQFMEGIFLYMEFLTYWSIVKLMVPFKKHFLLL